MNVHGALDVDCPQEQTIEALQDEKRMSANCHRAMFRK